MLSVAGKRSSVDCRIGPSCRTASPAGFCNAFAGSVSVFSPRQAWWWWLSISPLCPGVRSGNRVATHTGHQLDDLAHYANLQYHCSCVWAAGKRSSPLAGIQHFQSIAVVRTPPVHKLDSLYSGVTLLWLIWLLGDHMANRSLTVFIDHEVILSLSFMKKKDVPDIKSS